jgi:antirestriction protein
MTIKIYVASLEAYNAGEMVGNWVTPSDYEDYDKFRWAIMDATKNADEVAVHDYDGINISNEYPNFEDLYEFCQALENADEYMREPIIAYAENAYEDLNPDIVTKAEDYYIGTYSSFQEYADEWANEQLRNIDDFLKNYFDYESHARDIEYDYMVCDVSNYNVAVFSNC